MKIFKDRREAGRLLAQKLKNYQGKAAVVYGLPRGGIVVADEVAHELGLPLDFILAKKITSPLDPEYAVGAVSESGFMALRPGEEVNVVEDWFVEQLQKAKDQIVSQRLMLDNFLQRDGENQICILVDDGAATGLTMEAAVKEIKNRSPREIIVAVPVLPTDTAQRLRPFVDKLVVLEEPEIFLGAVGAFYEEFPQVTDEEVKRIVTSFRY